jgi:sporulation protein YlmC with PRC-barrel domain
MTKRMLSILLLSAAFPLAAYAQTNDGGTTIAPAAPSATQDGTMTNQDGATGTTAAPMGQTADASSTTEGPFVTVPESGAWRVSDFQGKAVYGTDGESIGEINDVLVTQDGSINAVIIGVGGFLGIGEKDVAVDMSALELGPGATQAEADAAATTLNSSVSEETTASTDTTAVAPAGGAATTGTGTAMTNDTAASGNTTTGTGMPAAGADADMSANDGGETIEIGEDGLPDRIVLNVTRQQLEDAPAFEGVRGEVQ